MKTVLLITIKKSSIIFVTLFLFVTCISFSSCSKDDDDDDSTKGYIKACYANYDNETTEYKYACLFRSYLASENTYQYSLILSDYDLMYYYEHPDKINDEIKVSTFMIGIESSDTYNAGNLPIGEITSDNYDCEISVNTPLTAIFEGSDEDYPHEQWYTLDWNPGYKSSPLIISKSGNMYKIEIREMKLLASVLGEGHVGSDSRKTTGSFYFEGIPQFYDMGNLSEEE